MRLTCYGAARGVTGSCHLLEIGEKRVLLDCGLFQGKGADEQNEPPLDFDASTIDVLLVSHAHLDHIGRIPLLWKEGFRGRIISTRPTYELARLSLLDSARLMDADASRARRKGRKDEPTEPLYDEEDVLDALDHWQEFLPYDKRFEVCEGVAVTMRDAGHIIGSAFLQLELAEGERELTLTFSGDLGNVNKPIIHDPKTPAKAEVVLMESTYGGREHRPFEESVTELEQVIRETVERGGNVMIPSFALERAQELLYVIYDAWRSGRIPKQTHIYLDSPMAIDATRIFTRHPEFFDDHALEMARLGGNPFSFEALTYTRHTNESMKINEHRSGAVIIAGSGMATGGRILHHMAHNLHRPECSLVFCGFQSHGTLGRRLVDGADEVRIHGQTIHPRAQIHTIGGFSGHAGKDTLLSWVKAAAPGRVLLVHGEPEVQDAFAEVLKGELAEGAKISCPELGVAYEL
jgi:metallo-beta-lactamase family protein